MTLDWAKEDAIMTPGGLHAFGRLGMGFELFSSPLWPVFREPHYGSTISAFCAPPHSQVGFAAALMDPP